IFFAFVGLKFALVFEAWPLILAVTATAFVGKLLGGLMGGRVAGFRGSPLLALGVGLNARGMMELLLAQVGLATGIINANVYSALVVMTLTTTLLTPPLMKRLLRRFKAQDVLPAVSRPVSARRGEDGRPRPLAQRGRGPSPARVVQSLVHRRQRRGGPRRGPWPRRLREEVADERGVLCEPEQGPRSEAGPRDRRRRGPRVPPAHEANGPAEGRARGERGDDDWRDPAPGHGAGRRVAVPHHRRERPSARSEEHTSELQSRSE